MNKQQLISFCALAFTWGVTAQNTFPSTGNTGIGTTNPSGPLHVKADSDNILTLQTSDNGALYTNWIDKDGIIRATTGFASNNLNAFQFKVLNGTNEFMIFDASKFYFRGELRGDGDIISHGATGPRIGQNGYDSMAYGLMGYRDGKIGDGNLYMMVRNKNTNNGSWISVGQRDSDSDKGDIKLIAGYFEGLDMRGNIKFSVGGGENVDAIIDYNGNMGVGTTDPNAKLEVADEIRVRLATNNTDKNVARIVPLGYSGVTGAMNWALRGTYQYGNGVNTNSAGGDLDLIKSLDRNTILATKTDGTSLGNVGIGTTSPDSKLTVKGKVHAEEVKVDLSVPGPDYVFANDYDLRTLEELQKYIQQNKHLPNIPSAVEMEANGVELGIMNMKLLEKIEELTLYTLEQEKKLKEQKEANQKLETRLSRLEELLPGKSK
ncbi:hypothetical protein GWK08_06015 [Leptobacterium flavescens]|uniref:Peptidase S74 domain-containing protein n=1 Tax=Leptobacterium flavescens TaxID=472055 RepID=A0A6P0URI7_9FLAO|nr:tail fiber protein [Leptobacterium flavescens]NER12986.1 hypothetical protein [Leptobacterium flavescens]